MSDKMPPSRTYIIEQLERDSSLKDNLLGRAHGNLAQSQKDWRHGIIGALGIPAAILAAFGASQIYKGPPVQTPEERTEMTATLREAGMIRSAERLRNHFALTDTEIAAQLKERKPLVATSNSPGPVDYKAVDAEVEQHVQAGLATHETLENIRYYGVLGLDIFLTLAAAFTALSRGPKIREKIAEAKADINAIEAFQPTPGAGMHL